MELRWAVSIPDANNIKDYMEKMGLYSCLYILTERSSLQKLLCKVYK